MQMHLMCVALQNLSNDTTHCGSRPSVGLDLFTGILHFTVNSFVQVLYVGFKRVVSHPLVRKLLRRLKTNG